MEYVKFYYKLNFNKEICTEKMKSVKSANTTLRTIEISSRHQGSGFKLKDYCEKAFPPNYTGTSPRRQFPDNINKYDNNVLNLSNRRAVSPNGKTIMYVSDAPPPIRKKVFF